MNNLNISTILVTDSELPDGFSSPEKLCLEQDERIKQKVKEHNWSCKNKMLQSTVHSNSNPSKNFTY